MVELYINVMLTPGYIKAEERVIKSNFYLRFSERNSKRLKVISDWVNGDPACLSVGSGGYEPLVCGAQDALDVSALAEDLLRSLNWTGRFKVGSCTQLPYPNDKFSKAYCSEVIEHLPSFEDVVRTFEELDRVAVDWLVTTPSRRRGCKNTDPDHKRDFDEEELRACITPKGYQIFDDGKYFYIVKERGDDEATCFREIFNRYNGQ